MRGLRKYLTPFAPDQSGAVSMCYALGGMVVIVDAGGCAGNICGFDEPRWQPDYPSSQKPEGMGPDDVPKTKRVGAVFSAGLRDMDAILGRDDFLVKKLEEASRKIDAAFIALIGTPVPTVIGTDLRSVAGMAERATGLPCIAVSTDGMHLYERGIGESLLALLERFSGDETDRNTDTPGHENASSQEFLPKRICGVLGLNPLDLFDPSWIESVRASLLDQGYDEVLLFGMDGGLEAFQKSSQAERNYVVSPAGIEAADYLKEKYQTPYEVSFPADPGILLEEDPAPVLSSLKPDSHILVVHQQVLANAIRRSLQQAGFDGSITAATWFECRKELALPGDVKLREEDDFISLATERKWDLIIADPTLKPMAAGYHGKWIDAFHFAVSGQAAIDRSRNR